MEQWVNPIIKFLLVSAVLTGTIGCAKKPPALLCIEIPVQQQVKSSEDKDLTYPALGNAKWTQDLISVREMQKRNLSAQLITDEQKVKFKTDTAHIIELHKELDFQTTVRLEQMRKKHQVKMHSPGNRHKAISLPQISFYGV